jgi:hypothetical protein
VEVGLIERIDWQAPWLAPWRALGRAVSQRVAAGDPQSAVLNQAALVCRGFPVCFVPQSDLPEGVAYEQHIFDTSQVPTREGLHDFFNGLVWLQFPLTKKRLNRLHVAQIAKTGIQPVHGPVRDALTLLDENAAFLQAPDRLWEALAAKDWRNLFVDLRALWRICRYWGCSALVEGQRGACVLPRFRRLSPAPVLTLDHPPLSCLAMIR